MSVFVITKGLLSIKYLYLTVAYHSYLIIVLSLDSEFKSYPFYKSKNWFMMKATVYRHKLNCSNLVNLDLQLLESILILSDDF